MKKMRKARKIALQITNGLINNSINFLLWQIYYTGSLVGKRRTAGSFWQAFYEANETLEEFNANTIKTAGASLIKKGFITLSFDKSTAKITKTGLKRLKSTIPFYDKERAWDEKIYLITYDIPETKKKDRDVLRKYLKRIGCGMLQASVWITPYNPKNILRDFINERKLQGSIIISNMGKDGSIGEDRVEELIEKVYKLNQLNEKYQEFISKYKNKENVDNQSLYFDYLSILNNDPQLPFKLLPKYWVGEKAYKIFLKHQ